MKYYVSYFLRAVSEIIFFPIRILSKFTPRNPDVWLFGAWHGKKYVDNTRFLYEYIIDNNVPLKAVWITRSSDIVKRLNQKGYECYLLYSLKGIFFSLRAKYQFITHSANDVLAPAVGSATLVNLTHGTPIKRIGHDATSRRLGIFTGLFDNYISCLFSEKRRFDYVIAASEIAKERFASAFHINSSKVKVFGYPRWNALDEDGTKILKKLGIEVGNYKKTIVFAPTLRKQGRGMLMFNDNVISKSFFKWLKETGTLFIVRPHSSLLMDIEITTQGYSDWVKIVSPSMLEDINEILGVADYLVTDYSSIMFDYAVIKKTIILYAPDLEDYMANDVGVYGDYTKEALGPVIKNWEDLPTVIDSYEGGGVSSIPDLQIIKYAGFFSRDSCKKIIDYFKEG